ERDHSYQGVGDQRVADPASSPWYDVQYTWGNTGVQSNPSQFNARGWRDRGGFEDNSITRCQRRGNLVAGQSNWRVPGRDRRYHAPGLVDRHAQIISPGR